MRKEVKLGMAIGGVLLSAGTIYLASNSGKKHPNPSNEITDSTGTGDNGTGTEGSPANGTDTPVQPEGAARTGEGTATTEAGPRAGESIVPDGAKDSTPATARGGESNNRWITLLSGETTVSRTPAGPGFTREGSRAIIDPTRGEVAEPAPRGEFGGGSLVGPGGGESGGVSAGPSLPVATGTSAAHNEPAASHNPRMHKVTAGENYSRISAAAYGTPKYYAVIAKANPKIEPTKLRPGMEIVLPDISEGRVPAAAGHGDATADAHTGRGRPVAAVAVDLTKEYRVQSGDSLHKISAKLYGTIGMVDKIYDANRDVIGPDKAKLKLNQVLKLPTPPTTLVH